MLDIIRRLPFTWTDLSGLLVFNQKCSMVLELGGPVKLVHLKLYCYSDLKLYPLACKETCRIYTIHLVWKFKPFTYGRGKICVAKSAEEITKRRNNFYVSLVDHNFGNCANENMT